MSPYLNLAPYTRYQTFWGERKKGASFSYPQLVPLAAEQPSAERYLPTSTTVRAGVEAGILPGMLADKRWVTSQLLGAVCLVGMLAVAGCTSPLHVPPPAIQGSGGVAATGGFVGAGAAGTVGGNTGAATGGGGTIDGGFHGIVMFGVDAEDSGCSAARGDIALGPDGNLWFSCATSSKVIGRISSDGQLTYFALKDGGYDPWAIFTGPDGNLWFAEDVWRDGNPENFYPAIGRMGPAGGMLGNYAFPNGGPRPF